MKKIALILVTFLLVIGFQNCGSKTSSNGNNDQTELSQLQIECGIEGFKVLHENYFVPNCATCHDSDGFAFPPFATDNIDTSYSWATSVGKDRMWETSINNRFCGPDCNIKPGDGIYEYFAGWMECE